MAISLGSGFFGLFELFGNVLNAWMILLRSSVIGKCDGDWLTFDLFFEDVNLSQESNHGSVNKDFGIDDFGEEF